MFLADVYRRSTETKYRDAARRALDFLLTMQAPSGGFPQVYPARTGATYSNYITFNDDAMVRLMELLREVSNGREGYTPPASVTLVGGDVHNAYVAEVSLGRSDPGRSRIHQLVCSPFRNPLPPAERRVLGLGWKPVAARPMELLARLAGVRRPSVRWRRRSGPTFENSIGILELDGRRAEAAIYRSVQDDPRGSLESLHTCVLSEGPRAGE